MVVIAIASVAIAGGACRTGGRPGRPSPPAIFTGLVSVIVGDPLPPAQTPQVQQFLMTQDGRKFMLLVDSASAHDVGDLRRFHGAVVRAVGRFHGADSTRLWVERIDSVPGRRR